VAGMVACGRASPTPYHAPASLQIIVCLFVTPNVPPTGADADDFGWVSAPNVVPFGVTNLKIESCRAYAATGFQSARLTSNVVR